MAALDLLGRRHVLRIVWELHAGPSGFRELRDRCEGLSPSTLSQRLTELRDAALVETEASGRNALTELGRSLVEALTPIVQWSRDWAKQDSRPVV